MAADDQERAGRPDGPWAPPGGQPRPAQVPGSDSPWPAGWPASAQHRQAGQPPPPPAGWPAPPGWGQQAAPPGWGQPPWGPPPYGHPGWVAQPGWAPDPRARRRRKLVAWGSLAGVVLLLVGALAVVRFAEDRRESRMRADVAAAVPALQAFVEQARGLPFREPVDVEVLGDDAFLDALHADDGEGDGSEEDGGASSEPTLTALGLLDPDADLEEEVTDALDAGVVGFYDPETDRLVVREGGSFTAATELVIVHELVHALQDQHFDIFRPELDEADDERSLAFTALVEGDASVVEQAWFAQQSPSRQREIERSFGSLSAYAEQDVVDALLGFPYLAGPPYVAWLLAEGGQPALDAAYSSPPTTSEQILTPSAPHAVDEVPAPPAPGEVVDEGVLGLLGLLLMLGLDPGDADALPGGWSGDRYVTWEDGDRACTRAHLAADDPVALGGALAAWAQEQPDAGVEAGPAGTVRLQTCAG